MSTNAFKLTTETYRLNGSNINYVFPSGNLKNYKWGIVFGTIEEPKLRPEKIYYDEPFTTVIWNDGTKTTVRANNENFTKEFGLAMAYMKKLYGNRSEFLRDVESGVDCFNHKDRDIQHE